ncbi:hypothetical protein NDU88_003513 [Pleurodeles waltl]|uniref:Uncharacterized protein n=1 Tax=Pleurodeles waltl TaxID=8319 RepID=A0AAV7MQS7_PLEWA|nr:hypothetical protein NDU88_003513 [Pleurodeles waltl]
MGVIPTPVGGGCRPLGGNRPNTAPRSIDRGEHSNFPAGPAGDLQKIARWLSGKAPAKMKPAPNGAGGFAGVRRVQLHPSRFSVSAKQTLKILMGPQGPHDTRSRQPLPGGVNRQEQAGGKGVGITMAALHAAPPWRIPWGSHKTLGVILTLAVHDRHGGVRRKHRQQAGGASWAILTVAVKPRSEKGSRRFPAGSPLAQGIRHGGAACSTAMGIPTPLPPACFWRCPPPEPGWRERTVKIATGATAPVAPLQLRRLHSEPASLLKGLSRWAGRRSSGGRLPAQRESRNDRRGLLTAAVF